MVLGLAIVALTILLWPARFGGATTLLVVEGDSMHPTLHHGDVVVARERGHYAVGDVVVFYIHVGDSRTRVMHRIVDIAGDGSIITQGDNRSTPDSFDVDADDVVGEMQLRLPRAGTGLWLLFAMVDARPAQRRRHHAVTPE